MARAFLAIVPPQAVVEAIAPVADEVVGDLGPAARPARCSQWHVTLKFFESVDLDELQGLLVHFSPPGLQLTLEGFGAFPSERKARVVWLGLGRDADRLETVAAEVERLTAPLSPVAEEEHPRSTFHPHLTMARMRVPRDIRSDIAGWRARHVGPFAHWSSAEVLLVRSEPRPQGVRHQVVERYGTGPGPDPAGPGPGTR